MFRVMVDCCVVSCVLRSGGKLEFEGGILAFPFGVVGSTFGVDVAKKGHN
jgi:hypothetical protein